MRNKMRLGKNIALLVDGTKIEPLQIPNLVKKLGTVDSIDVYLPATASRENIEKFTSRDYKIVYCMDGCVAKEMRSTMEKKYSPYQIYRIIN